MHVSELTSLNANYGPLKDAGIKVVAITAEPGGEAVIRERLTGHKVPKLDFDVVSDPKHEFLQTPNAPKDIFVTLDHEWDVSGPYKMVQPALVVYDADGGLMSECSWSWKTMGHGDDEWNTRVDTQAWEGPIKQVMLVTFRPLIADLQSAIQEKRAVKLSSTNSDW